MECENGTLHHVCPKCGSEHTRYFLDVDVDHVGDVEGWLCEDCGYEGDESEFEVCE